jgi:hypothetical protein
VNRRIVLVTVGWLGAAVLAALVGLAAISVIGNGLTAPATRPLSAAEVADELARQIDTSPPSPSPSPSPSSPSATAGTGDRPSPTASVATQSFPTGAGTVIGRCVGGRPELVSMSPRQGYEVHDQDDNEGEFRSRGDNHDRVKFEIVCRDGVPTLIEDD